MITTARSKPSVREVVFIGDIGGQIDVFRQVLTDLGIDPDRPVIPCGMRIVQVGDIVRGTLSLPSYNCVLLADRLLSLNPGCYTQLLGNHEVAHLDGAAYPAHWELDPRAGDIVRRWWHSRMVRLAVCVPDVKGRDTLVTHAGLSFGYWEHMGRPRTAVEAMRGLNRHVGGNLDEFLSPGWLVTGGTNAAADPLWAETNRELLPRWLANQEPVPFPQIHGHSSPFDWGHGCFWPAATAEIVAATEVNAAERRSRTRVGTLGDGASAVFESVDWILGNRRSSNTWPLLRLPRAA